LIPDVSSAMVLVRVALGLPVPLFWRRDGSVLSRLGSLCLATLCLTRWFLVEVVCLRIVATIAWLLTRCDKSSVSSRHAPAFCRRWFLMTLVGCPALILMAR
jgi:hypothetical protein